LREKIIFSKVFLIEFIDKTSAPSLKDFKSIEEINFNLHSGKKKLSKKFNYVNPSELASDASAND